MTRGKLYARRVAAVLGVFTVVTVCDVGVAHADTSQVKCGDHNRQAVINYADLTMCFEGVGKSWTHQLRNVRSVWAGPYTVVLSFDNNGGDPLTVRPFTSARVNPTATAVSDVQLLKP